MALPVNIEKLINGKTVEWERLEFKKGWNPKVVMHTMCAFANDINDWDGGYIIIGIDEDNGRPVLPPQGLEAEQIDSIQKDVIELCNQHMQPNYRPIIEPEVYQDRQILILWCPAGDMRPYKVPKNLGKEKNNKLSYIRSGANTIEAKGENLRQLQELTARTPFDDRINQEATMDDLDLGLMREYLQEIKSRLFDESHNMPFKDLCRQMHIVKGGSESLRPVNVGFMFFNKNPEHFFPYAHIEMVVHKDDSGRNFIEKVFKGPLNRQLTDALEYISNNIIVEEVVKSSQKAEADRFYNYPYEAVEEVLSNAVYHKGYDQANPIEVQVYSREAIEVLSYPGPVPPIDNQMLQRRRVTARHYRNRRIGEFLKELDLTEGKATGFPVIRNAMKNNGSPEPEFFTDKERTIFQATLKIHPWFTEHHPEERKFGKFHISSKDWNIQSLEDVDALLEYLLNNIYDQVSDQVRAIDKSLQKSNNQEYENSGAIDGTKEGAIDNTESDQVGNQVESKENESDTSKDSRLSYRESNYVGDIVRAIVGDVVSDVVSDKDNDIGSDIVNVNYMSDNQDDTSDNNNRITKSDIGSDIVDDIEARGGIKIYKDKEIIPSIKHAIDDRYYSVCNYCLKPKKRSDILRNVMGLRNHPKNYSEHLKPLVDLKWLSFTIPDKLTSQKQAYYTTIKGKLLLLIMNKKND